MTTEFPSLNRAELWLSLFRRYSDQGLTVAEARRRTDAALSQVPSETPAPKAA